MRSSKSAIHRPLAAGVLATLIGLTGTISAASATAATTKATPEALIWSAAAESVQVSDVAPNKFDGALDVAVRATMPSPATGTVSAMTVVPDPDSIVLDVHEDAVRDTPQEPELIGAEMQVYKSDPDFVTFYGWTSSQTAEEDFASVRIDADGDGLSDFATGSPIGGFPADEDWVDTDIYRFEGDELVETGYVAGWIRTADGYIAILDRTELGLSYARFVFGLMDTSTDDLDFAPELYTGAPVRLTAAPIGVRATVAKAGYGNLLSVNVNPDRGSASYAFSVQKLSGGRWSDVTGLYRTQGNGETRSITLSKGTYRVSVRAGQGYAAAVSNAVTLTDKTVKVAAGRDSAKSQLKVNVDPNQGSGYWKFQLQKRTTSGTWSAKKVYLTQGSGETRTINLTKGTYRVVVAGNHGYKGAASAPVTLVK